MVVDKRINLRDYSFIGNHDDSVFGDIDSDLKLRYFFSKASVNVQKEVRIKIFQQKEFITCMPMDVFHSIGNVSELAFPSEKYIKSIVKDYPHLLYFHWFGTFFLYKNESNDVIIAQVVFEEGKLAINIAKDDAFRIRINGMNRTRFVCFDSSSK